MISKGSLLVERTRESKNQYRVPVTSAVRWNTCRKHSIATVTLQTKENFYWDSYTALHLFGESTRSNISSKHKSTHKRLRTKEYTELRAIQIQTEVHKIVKICTKDNFYERVGLYDRPAGVTIRKLRRTRYSMFKKYKTYERWYVRVTDSATKRLGSRSMTIKVSLIHNTD